MAERPARESLAQRVARELGTAILQGHHPPGTVLPTEDALCGTYRVGRNVLREAVKTLVGKGMLATQRRAGTIVQPRARWNLLDLDVLLWMVSDPGLRESLLDEITQLRLMLEPEVAALAAEHARDEQITALDLAYARMERERFDERRAVEADIAFHELLFEATGSSLVQSLLRAFVILLRANFELAIQAEGGFIRNLEQHRWIVEALRARDPERARLAMRALLLANAGDLARMRGSAAERERAERGRSG